MVGVREKELKKMGREVEGRVRAGTTERYRVMIASESRGRAYLPSVYITHSTLLFSGH